MNKPDDYQKPKLLILLEAIQMNPNPPNQKYIRVTEYQWSVANAALECVPELKALFQSKTVG